MGGTDALPAPGLPGLLGRYVAVVTAVAASLLVLDAVPWLLTGAVRGIVTQRSIGEAESALGAALLVPADAPRAYRWPPVSVRISTRGVRAAALLLTPSSEGDDSLLFVQTVDGDALPPEGLLPAGKEIHRVDFDLDGTPARMTVLLLPPDGTFHEVSFLRAGRRVVFRFRGDPEKPLLVARSLPRGAPR